MIYKKERRFLNNLPIFLIKDLLEYNFLNNNEKQLFKLMYIEKRSIDNIVINKLMPYERSWLFLIYKSGLCKLNKFIKNTEKVIYKRFYDILI